MDFGVRFDGHSVLLTEVVTGTPADRMGLCPGDRLTHICGIPVSNPLQVASTWAMRFESIRSDVTVWRDGGPVVLPIPESVSDVAFSVVGDQRHLLPNIAPVDEIDLRAAAVRLGEPRVARSA